MLERPNSGPAKRVTANELFNFLGQGTVQNQVASHLNVESMMPRVGWTPEQLKEYLEKPPAGKERKKKTWDECIFFFISVTLLSSAQFRIERKILFFFSFFFFFKENDATLKSDESEV